VSWRVAARLAGRLAAPGGRGGRLIVVTYHRVLPEPHPIVDDIDAATFERHVRTYARCFNVLSLHDAAARLAADTLPPRALCITFDDGYANNVEVGLPILQRFGLPATFFVASSYVRLGIMWNDVIIESLRASSCDSVDLGAVGLGRLGLATPAERRAALPRIVDHLKYLAPPVRQTAVEDVRRALGVGAPPRVMMSAEQVRRLARAGMEIGAHTRTHPILTRIPDAEAQAEIEGSRADLERHAEAPVRSFAYPNGRPSRDYGPQHVEMVRRAGFSCAVSTSWGRADRDADPYQLPRITAWGGSEWKVAARVVRAYGDRAAFA
jgi:peptidoglycan/xylan/chitin deacetylase (PgdA/CDA1 family)